MTYNLSRYAIVSIERVDFKGNNIPYKIMERAGIYIRKSRNKEDNKESYRLAIQREDLPIYCQKQGWEHEIYDEGITSGKTISDRPQIRKLLKDIETGFINIIIVIDLTRLTRDTNFEDAAKIIATCKRNGCRIATRERIYNPQDLMEQFFLLLNFGFSGLEM